jgi:L-fuculose-phosphate aldolase
MRDAHARQTVVELCLALSRRGHLAGTGGNIALRTDAHHMVVTPSAIDYLVMTAADVCVLSITDLVKVDGERTPSVESGLHARVLRARPEVHCSIHTHQPVASACALLGRPLAVPPGPLRESLGPVVPIAGYAPSGSGWLSAKVARALRPDVNAYLMFDHGALCCGRTPELAVQAVEQLEALCRAHLGGLIAARATRDAAQRAALQRVLDTLAASSSESPPYCTP